MVDEEPLWYISQGLCTEERRIDGVDGQRLTSSAYSMNPSRRPLVETLRLLRLRAVSRDQDLLGDRSDG